MNIPGLRRSPVRTTLLGVSVLGVLLWMAAGQLQVDPNSLIAQLLVLLLALGLVMLAALAFVVLIAFLRRAINARRS
ncbi:MAG: hypothetical protein AAGI88_14550 [Pseudomonadota bacterium]